jgi:hypothetical protein
MLIPLSQGILLNKSTFVVLIHSISPISPSCHVTPWQCQDINDRMMVIITDPGRAGLGICIDLVEFDLVVKCFTVYVEHFGSF